MAKQLTEDDKQWLKKHPGFHVAGRTSLAAERSTNSNGSNTRAVNMNDGHVYEMHRTFDSRLREYELMRMEDD